ncbi:MAG: hypothetical protein ACR2OI_08320 [Acidimicrobiia bacterium]
MSNSHETLKLGGSGDVSVHMNGSFPYRATLLSLIGAALGSTLWLLLAIAGDLERAFPALLVGLLAGGATRLEPRRGRPVQVAALAFTLVCLTIVQYLVVRHAIVTDLVDAGADRSVPMLLSPASMWSVTFGWLRIYPIDAVFWVLSAAAALALPAGGETPATRGVAALASEA